MITKKSAKKQLKAFKKFAADGYGHIGANEKLAGAALIGVGIGIASTMLKPFLQNVATAKPAKNKNKVAS